MIIAVLALWILWLLSLPIWSGMSTISGVVPPPDWFKKANPVLLVYAPYSWPGYVAPTDVAIFVAAVLLLSTALIARTIATVRRSVLEPARRVQAVAFLDRSGSRTGWRGCPGRRSTAIPCSGASGIATGRRD